MDGYHTGYFNSAKGLRQGDIISHYLFFLCMDKLSYMIIYSVECGKWKGIKEGRRCPTVSHLMFVDDLLLFGKETINQMDCVRDFRDKFCNISRQRISKDMTRVLFSSNTPNHVRRHLIQMSGYKETKKLEKHLGVPSLGEVIRKKIQPYQCEY